MVSFLPVTAGHRWSDTLSLGADPGEGLWETLEGIWEHEVVGDTVFDGRSLPLVRTIATVTYRSRELVPDLAFDEPFEILRDVAGTIRGYAAVDTAFAVRAVGTDTMRLAGTAVLRTGDGCEFPSGVVYERYQSWLLQDTATWAATREARLAAIRRQAPSIVPVPGSPLEERLLAGDQAAIDSLIAAWRDADDPNERAALRSLLLSGTRIRPERNATVDRLRELQLEAGDSASIITSGIAVGVWRPDSPESLGAMLPCLDDPGRLWKLGHVPSRVYWSLGLQLLETSPLIATQPFSCSREVCDLLLHMLDAVSEPRLNDAILMSAFARDPARWYDRIVQRADVPRAIPEPGAPWQAWQRWPTYASKFWRDNDIALRLYSARTGRDVIGELLEVWRSEPDPAREVYDHILQALDVVGPPPIDDLAATLASESDDELRRAKAELSRLMRTAVPADDAFTLRFLQPLVDSIASRGAFPWASLRPRDSRAADSGWAGSFGRSDADAVPIYVLEDGLPSVLAASLPSPLISPRGRRGSHSRGEPLVCSFSSRGRASWTSSSPSVGPGRCGRRSRRT